MTDPAILPSESTVVPPSGPINPLNEYVAAQLSGAAYTPPTLPFTAAKGLPAGWADVTDKTRTALPKHTPYYDSKDPLDPAKSNNEFRIFANESTHQLVVAFKGSNKAQNWASDLNPFDQGHTSYKDVAPAAQAYFDQLKSPGSPYQNYAFFADGHSLGGGMAQSFAIQNHIGGFGQNSLPIPEEFIKNYQSTTGGTSFKEDLATYRTTQKFDEVNVSGDIATNFYSSTNHFTGGQYIDQNPRTLNSPYAKEEIGELALAAVPGFHASAAAALATGGNAHLLGTYERLIQEQGNYGNWAPMGMGPALNQANPISEAKDNTVSAPVIGAKMNGAEYASALNKLGGQDVGQVNLPVANGDYSGKVIQYSDSHIVQKVGPHEAIAHDVSTLSNGNDLLRLADAGKLQGKNFEFQYGAKQGEATPSLVQPIKAPAMMAPTPAPSMTPSQGLTR